MLKLNKGQISDFNAQSNPWSAIDKLGKGSFGVVQVVALACEDSTGKKLEEGQRTHPVKFARKRFEHPSTMLKDAADLQRKEHAILLSLSKLSPMEQTHMVRLVHAYTIDGTSNSAQHYLVMHPVADGGNLVEYLDRPHRPLSSELSKMMGCLVIGLAVLHQANIRHHDIHPRNILVHQGQPLYTDFGLSYYFENSSNSKTRSDNPKQHWQFAAPEYKDPHQSRGRKADIFGLGGVLYEIAAVWLDNRRMQCCRPTQCDYAFCDPEESKEARDALDDAIKQAKFDHNWFAQFWLKTIHQMLEFDPKNRPSACDIFDQVRYKERLMCSSCLEVLTYMKKGAEIDRNFSAEHNHVTKNNVINVAKNNVINVAKSTVVNVATMRSALVL